VSKSAVEENLIYSLYYCRHPLAFRFGSYLALFRPMAIAHLVEKLYDFSDLRHHTFQRLQRTRLLIRDLIWYGINSEQGQKAIRHINVSHSKVDADNDAYRYVLCCFFLEPFRWNMRYEKTQISADNKQSVIDFWNEIGRRMGLSQLCRNEEEWLGFQQDYEHRFMRYSEQGRKLAQLSLNETPRLAFPPIASHLVRQVLRATFDENIRRTLRLQAPSSTSILLVKFLPALTMLAREKKKQTTIKAA